MAYGDDERSRGRDHDDERNVEQAFDGGVPGIPCLDCAPRAGLRQLSLSLFCIVDEFNRARKTHAALHANADLLAPSRRRGDCEEDRGGATLGNAAAQIN